MSTPQNLKEIYIDELKDLWSANDQMHDVVGRMIEAAGDPQLKTLLTKSLAGIAAHTGTVRTLIAAHDDDVAKDHCKGMEGLVKEARKHALASFDDHDAQDVVLIAQYQRMSHYGIAGFGTATAYAEALGLDDDAEALDAITQDIYGGDEYATLLAERSVNLAAK